jgi:hypothetical protein
VTRALARDNPFRTARIGALAFRPRHGSTPELAERLARLDFRAEIVGPHGSGKTTLLGELAEHLAHDGHAILHWRLQADRPQPPVPALVRAAARLGPRHLLLVDGAGHLSRAAWWCVARAARGARGLLITAHAPGRLPTLLETTTDRALLRALVGELLGPKPPALDALLDTLYERCRGNLRDVFLALYDLAAAGDPRLPPARGGAQEFSSSTSGPGPVESSPASPISSSSGGSGGPCWITGVESSASVVGMPMRKAATPGITT